MRACLFLIDASVIDGDGEAQDIMTEEQCRTCARPTKHCQDPQFKHLMNCSCLDYLQIPVDDSILSRNIRRQAIIL